MATIGMLAQLLRREGTPPRLAEGLRYLEQFASGSLLEKEPGFVQRVYLAGEELFAIEQVYVSKEREQARFEAHRRYIDIQYLIAGREDIFVKPVEGCAVDKPYQEENDIVFFRTSVPQLDHSTRLVMDPGIAAILFPEDAHAPGIQNGQKQVVRKVVVKIKC